MALELGTTRIDPPNKRYAVALPSRPPLFSTIPLRCCTTIRTLDTSAHN